MNPVMRVDHQSEPYRDSFPVVGVLEVDVWKVNLFKFFLLACGSKNIIMF